jgi:hypothetical protein
MISSRIGLMGQGFVVMILAACAGCSSSSSNPDAGTSSSSSGSGSGSGSGSSSGGTAVGDGGTPVVDGTGPACTKTYPLSVGTLVTVAVSWPGTAAVAKGSGNFYIWLLTTYSADSSNKITGTTFSCGNAPAVLTLSATGDIALGVPSGMTGLIKPEYPADSWDGTPGTAITGTLGGTNTGSSFLIDPSVTLYGLKASDPLSDPTMKWPTSYSALTQSDLTYADGGAYVAGMGHPGIRGTFDSTPPYYLSGTSLAPGAPKADQFWSATRTQLGLYGLSKSCTETTGTANVTLINNRVVGCELIDGGGPCTTDQYGFLDSNTTQYAPGAGSFDSKDLSSGATCADVLTALPAPSM